MSLEAKDNRMTVKAGKSRFNLQTLAAADFPRMVEAKDASKTLTAAAEGARRTRSAWCSSPWRCRTSATT